MNVLDKWGVYILAPQGVLGGLVYAEALSFSMGDVALDGALVAAAAVAVAWAVGGMLRQNLLLLALALSSAAGMAMLFFADLGGIGGYILAGIFGFFCLATALIAALLADSEGLSNGQTLGYVVMRALPVVGTCMYLSSRLDEEREKMFKG